MPVAPLVTPEQVDDATLEVVVAEVDVGGPKNVAAVVVCVCDCDCPALFVLDEVSILRAR